MRSAGKAVGCHNNDGIPHRKRGVPSVFFAVKLMMLFQKNILNLQFSQNLTNFDKEFTRRKRLNTENMKNDFRDYAVKHLGMNPLALTSMLRLSLELYLSDHYRGASA